MARQDIVQGLKHAMQKGHSLKEAMQSFYNAGYKKEEIEEAAREIQGIEIESPVKEIQNNRNIKDKRDNKKQIVNNIASQKPSNIKYRNPVLVLIFSILTLGIYTIFWLYFTTKELHNNTSSAPKPWHIFLLFIPLFNVIWMFIFYWKYFKAVNELTGVNNIFLFLLMFLLAPVGIVVTQMELNKKSSKIEKETPKTASKGVSNYESEKPKKKWGFWRIIIFILLGLVAIGLVTIVVLLIIYRQDFIEVFFNQGQ